MRKHSERCKECKVRVFELLRKIYGQENVLQNHNLQLPNKVEQFKPNDLNQNLENIFHKLQECREHREFVRSKKLPNVDYFVKNQFILEFDESQHFTKPRLISLENYSDKLSLGYKKEKWMKLCEKLDKKDNDPPFRDGKNPPWIIYVNGEKVDIKKENIELFNNDTSIDIGILDIKKNLKILQNK